MTDPNTCQAIRQLRTLELFALNRFGATIDFIEATNERFGIHVDTRTVQRDIEEINGCLHLHHHTDYDTKKNRWVLELSPPSAHDKKQYDGLTG